jgi:hypothetical protein
MQKVFLKLLLNVFYKLTLQMCSASWKHFVAEAGGKKVKSFEFKYHGDNLSLQWKGDLKTLVQHYGELTNYMMEWVRSWLNPQIEDVKCYVCSPNLGPLLLAHVEEQQRDVLEVYVAFIHDKYGALPPQDIKT